MKMKKMVGAIALTAALAMGTMPAFAQGSVTSTDEQNAANAFSDSGSTEIKAKIDTVNKNVRATVPLEVTVVFAGQGASEILGPKPSTYKIKNIGQGNIQIKDAEITANDKYASVFSIAPIDTRDFDDATNGDFSRFSGNTLSFSYATTQNKTYLTPSHKLSQATQAADGKYISGAQDFAPETLTPNQELEITLGGMAVFPTSVSQDNLTDTLCNIKYTIAAAS